MTTPTLLLSRTRRTIVLTALLMLLVAFPALAQDGQTLFYDNFESSTNGELSSDWLFFGDATVITVDDNNVVRLSGTNNENTEILLNGGYEWTDYALEAWIMFKEVLNNPDNSDLLILTRSDVNGVNFSAALVNVANDVGGVGSVFEGEIRNLQTNNATLRLDTWYYFRLEAIGDRIELKLDGDQVVWTSTRQQLAQGTVGFFVNGGVELYVDEILVMDLTTSQDQLPMSAQSSNVVNPADYTFTTDTTLGKLNANDSFEQQFEAVPGDLVTISAQATSTGLDTKIVMVGPDGEPLIENDDHGTDSTELAQLDSLIELYEIQQAGTYTVVVTDFAGAAGQFSLTITQGTLNGGSSSGADIPPVISSITGSGSCTDQNLLVTWSDADGTRAEATLDWYSSDGEIIFTENIDGRGGSFTSTDWQCSESPCTITAQITDAQGNQSERFEAETICSG